MLEGDLITGDMGGNYRLMGFGAVRAEEIGVAPVELARINQKARTDILLALAKVMDVVVWREREYYLLEGKWEKNPIEAGVVRELFGKLGNRVGVNGIVTSMSGFSKGAAEQTEEYAAQHVILLFGEEAIKKLVYGHEKFADLLDIKYRQLSTKRRAELT